MTTRIVFLSMAVLCVIMAGSLCAAEKDAAVEKPIKLVMNYNQQYKCVMVCKAPKPTLEILEDGLAYALDLPLAMLSPITVPIMTPLLEKYDSDPDRTYHGRKARR